MADPESLLTSPAFLEILQALGLNTVDADAFQMLEDARQQVVLGELSVDEYETLKASVALQLKQAALQLAIATGGPSGAAAAQPASGSAGGGIMGAGGRALGSMISGGFLRAKTNGPVEVPEGEKPICEGELLKAPVTTQFAHIGQKNFKKRWIVLYKGCIIYYKAKGEAPSGRIDLSPDFFVQDSNAHVHSFVISDMNVTLTLGAETEDVKGYWMHSVLAVIRKLKEKAQEVDHDVQSAHPDEYKQIYESRLEEFKKSKQNRRKSFFFRKKKEQEDELIKKAGQAAIKQTYEDMKVLEKKRQQELEELEKKLLSAEDEAKKFKTVAEEESERARKETERAETEKKRADELEAKAGFSLEQWQAEARQREKELQEERDKIAVQLDEIQKKRRLSMMPGSQAMQFDIEKFEKERKALQAKLDALSKALDLDVNSLEWDGTLEDAEEKMKELVPKLCSEDEKEAREAQVMFDQWDKIIRNHADYKIREEKKWQQWESDQKEKNLAAMKEMKKLAPPEIITGVDKEFLMKLGLLPTAADRVLKTKILNFMYMDPETIAKIHIADLSSRYVIQGLDIVELRAIYACLPAEFQLDADGKKAIWRETARAKLHQMTQKEAEGKLSKNDARHPAYRPPEAKPAGGALGGGGGAPGGIGGAAGRGNPMGGALAGLFAGRGGPPGAGGPGGRGGGLPPPGANAIQNALAAKLAGGLPPKAMVQSEEAAKKEEVKQDAAMLLGILHRGKSASPEPAAAAAAPPAAPAAKSPEPTPSRPIAGSISKPDAVSRPVAGSVSKPDATSPTSRPIAGSVSKPDSTSPTSRPIAGSVSKPDAGKPPAAPNGSGGGLAARFEQQRKEQEATKAAPKQLDLGYSFNAGGAPAAAASPERKASLLSKDAQDLLNKMRERSGTGEFTGEVKAYDFLGAQEERSKKAAWVDEGIVKVGDIIKKYGKKDAKEGGEATLTFGEIYKNFGDGSDMLVGILMRGKKQKKIKYAGDMLFKDVHDNVKITLL